MDFKYQYRSQDLEYHHELNQFPDENNFFFHVDPYCEIYGFISGDCYFQVEGTRYELKGPTILILGQGEAHSLNLITKMPYEREVVHFTPELVKIMDPDGLLLEPFFNRPFGEKNLISVDKEKSKQLWAYMNAMHSTSTDPQVQRLTMLAYLFPLLYEIRCEYNRLSKTVLDKEEDAVDKIVKYINDNLGEKLNIEDIARQFFLSPSQLNRIFKQRLGSSVYQYIQLKRLLKAHLLLKSGKASGEVARICGYTDYSCFYKAYRKNFGVSPGSEK